MIPDILQQAADQSLLNYFLAGYGILGGVISGLALFIRQSFRDHRQEIKEMQVIYTESLGKITLAVQAMNDEIKTLNTGLSIDEKFKELEIKLLKGPKND